MDLENWEVSFTVKIAAALLLLSLSLILYFNIWTSLYTQQHKKESWQLTAYYHFLCVFEN